MEKDAIDREDPQLRELVGRETLEKADDDTIRDTISSLHHHLLGPSLTKAGQDSVNQTKVSEIIYNASKGSRFFKHEESKDRVLTEKINRTLALKRQLDKLDLASDRRRADDSIAEMEISRDLSQYIVHIDCDAFYAAVEELDKPELKNVPMAVGKGVLTTCNYHARKFGCRSGMAGFVAMKLCPELIRLPLNFEKYTSKAEEVRAIIAEYDSRFGSASIDEAYLNITEYCDRHQRCPDEVVSQLRTQVQEKAKVTISAGIAANATLAKICSNRNKPNGQFRLANERTTIMSFIAKLPVRKVNGVGRVFERELDAIGIKNCGDIYEHRASLAKIFGDKAFQFLMRVYLGLGRTQIGPAEARERKSVGTESTFQDMSDLGELKTKLWIIAKELEKDMERTECKGYTLCIKCKLHTYEVMTRQTTTPRAINRAEDLYNYSLPMLEKLSKEIRPTGDFRLRLMGLRCTHLVTTKKGDVDEFFRLARSRNVGTESHRQQQTLPKAEGDGSEWEIWPNVELDAEEKDQHHDAKGIGEVNVSLPPSLGQSSHHGREILAKPPLASEPHKLPVTKWSCPICGLSFSVLPGSQDHISGSARTNGETAEIEASIRDFNAHIDHCLSKPTIAEAVRETVVNHDDNDDNNVDDDDDDDDEGNAVAALFSGKSYESHSSSNNRSEKKRKRGRPPRRAGVMARREDQRGSGHKRVKGFFFA
ncbi:MAG: hypothetical protein M1831_004662 [Alyxoria varia]|nr:MAG: hypothetical protein M1831_004662 [Alyxoria varia]